MGDIHGAFNAAVQVIKSYSIKNANLIQLGDFGVGFSKTDKYNISVMNSKLKELNIDLYVIRGNHDDPKWFDGKRQWDNILFLKDYTILNDGRTILLAGGAISIDRNMRKEDVSYWRDEDFKLKEASPVNIIITHDCPRSVLPFIYNPLNDYNIQMDIYESQNKLDKLRDMVVDENTISWYYGHHHTSNTEYINNVKYCCLNIAEITKI